MGDADLVLCLTFSCFDLLRVRLGMILSRPYTISNITLVFILLQMLRKLSKQLNGEDWSWNNLNTLCWAIGSISGSMMEEQVRCTMFLLFGNVTLTFLFTVHCPFSLWVLCKIKP